MFLSRIFNYVSQLCLPSFSCLNFQLQGLGGRLNKDKLLSVRAGFPSPHLLILADSNPANQGKSCTSAVIHSCLPDAGQIIRNSVLIKSYSQSCPQNIAQLSWSCLAGCLAQFPLLEGESRATHLLPGPSNIASRVSCTFQVAYKLHVFC